MVDWDSPEALAREAVYSFKIIHVLAGWYYWEYLASFEFEWMFYSGQKIFRWPMIFYFGARYSILMVVTCLLTLINVESEINCGALLTIAGLAGQASSGFTSLIFATRTMAIWDFQPQIVYPLCLLIIGHWVSICLGGLSRGSWIPGTGCSSEPFFHGAIVSTLIYALCFDLLVTALAIYKLVIIGTRRSHLVDLMLKDGLIYYIIAFSANVPAVAALFMSSNPIVVQLFNFPASVTYTIAGTRAVRRLANFQNSQRGLFRPHTTSTGRRLSAPAAGTVMSLTQLSRHDERDATFEMKPYMPFEVANQNASRGYGDVEVEYFSPYSVNNRNVAAGQYD